MAMMNAAHEDVIALLTENRATLEAMAHALLDKETLDAEEINQLISAAKKPDNEGEAAAPPSAPNAEEAGKDTEAS